MPGEQGTKVKEAEAPAPRLLTRYREEAVPAMTARFGYGNRLAVPRLGKVVIDMGVGRATAERRRIERAVEELALITGQKPVVTRARKSVAGFKLRKGDPVGCKVTLRGKRMYEFLDRLLSVALTRVRDFRGLSMSAFDAAGNYTLGLNEQTVFPEVDLDKVEFTQGMHITLVVSHSSPEESRELLRLLGVPFRSAEEER
jgi:large subunit ribosomal protein L5